MRFGVCSSLQLAASVTSTVRLDDECYVTGCIISHMVLQSGYIVLRAES